MYINIIKRIEEKFPDWKFEIINYNQKTKELEIKCLLCGQIKRYKRYYDLIYKQNSCICNSSSSQYKSIQQKKELEQFFQETNDFIFVQWTEIKSDKNRPGVIIQCSKCKQNFIRRTSTFLNKKECPYCVERGIPNTLSTKYKLKEKGYTLLSDYKDQETNVLIRHDKCGFIWKVKPINFKNNLDGNCPQCNRLISKGERKIIDFLEKSHIEYHREHSFSWQSHKLFRYDFFIPDYNLIIEFNGRQHYEETGLFSSSLEETQEHDKIKIEEAKKNNFNLLIIPYTHINNIEKILIKWFNDYPLGVDNKLMIIERNAILNVDENIV